MFEMFSKIRAPCWEPSVHYLFGGQYSQAGHVLIAVRILAHQIQFGG